MQYRHGSTTFNDAEFGLRGLSRVRIRSGRNRAMVERVTLASEFHIIADGQAAITARYAQLYAALKQEGVDSGFLENSGAKSALFLTNSGSRTGVQVVQGPDLNPLNGADYATGHVGSYGVSAEYNVDGQDQLLDYRETVTIQGNAGPIEVGITTDVMPTLFVQTAQYSPVFMSQQGYAVGLNIWPLPNPPLWANASGVRLINPAESISYDAPRANGNDRFEYRVAWSYRFQADGPQSGLPLIR